MDEAGQDEYIDAHSISIMVPNLNTQFSSDILVRRKSKRITLHCICIDGTYIKPLVIIHRKMLDNITLKTLYCNNVMIKFQEKGFNNTE